MLDFESEVIHAMNERITQSFLDVLILLELRKEGALDDHDIIARIQNKFQLAKKPEGVLSVLDLLEKNELIIRRYTEKSMIFALTDKGLQRVNAVLRLRDKILGLVLNMLAE